MSAVLITFKEIPRFGFAHHIYTEKTHQIQNDIQHSFVLVYVKSGCLIAKVYERIIKAPAGSVLVLFRHMPFQLFSEQDTHQDYCSIQVFTDYTFDILEENDDYPANFAGLALPFIVPAGNEAEQIKKDMLSIIAWLSISREAYSFGAAMTMCGILHRLDTFYRQKLHQGKRTSYWENKIKRYVADHIQFPISLEDIGTFLGKSPNYLNNVFSKATGISIHKYINREKMRLATVLMEERGLTFGEACENVGIADLSHGYRLFKRHMGVTPKEYLSAERLK